MEDTIKILSNLLHKMFVINNSAAAIQQPDGRYITKYMPFNTFVVESVLKAKGSIGCYQQSYYTGFVKWICFDFDCRDKEQPDVLSLYELYIIEFLNILDKHEISYLTEFSGRRGIHVWIIFNKVIKKSLAYSIVSKLYGLFSLKNEDDFIKKYNIDLFPATYSSKGNKVGKQVKMPLSCHKSGGQSFFFEKKIKLDAVNEEKFFEEQKNILEKYKLNDIDKICLNLEVSREDIFVTEQRFKRFKLVSDIYCSAYDIERILSETIVFKKIFERLNIGNLLEQDWFVILGTLSPIDNTGSILHTIFSKSPVYNQETSSKMIEKWRMVYFPATFKYLYHIYGLDIESYLEKDITGLEYLLKKLCQENSIQIETINYEKLKYNELDNLKDIICTVEKECKYIMYNDENIDISIWNKLNNIKGYDLIKLKEIVNNIETNSNFDMKDMEIIVYERVESEDKIRSLVSLGAYDRVITTHMALQLAYALNKRSSSFSYNVIFVSRKDIFYNWYKSWKNYIGQIKMFIENPYLSEWNVMTIDIKNFYDHIDFLSVYGMFENSLKDIENRIFKYLINYNDKVMRKINGTRIGVPQGPAYARIISEIFLGTILNNISEINDNENCKMYRYVDDIIIFYTEEIDGDELFDKIKVYLKENGMDINLKKSKNYGKIKSLSSENRKKILKSNTFNYNLQISQNNMILTDLEKSNKFRETINNEFNINDVSFIFGNKTDVFFTQRYFKKFKNKIFSEVNGRGSNFASFYRFLFMNITYLDEAISDNCFSLIDFNSINFKNCISQMYIALKKQYLGLDEIIRIEKHFFNNVDMNIIDESERITINSIIKWRNNNGKC